MARWAVDEVRRNAPLFVGRESFGATQDEAVGN